MNPDILIWGLAILLILAGLAGLVLPALPGPPLLLAGLLIGAWLDEFRYVGPWLIAILILMTVLAYAVDFAASAFGAKRFGASPRAAVGAAVGALVGIFFGPVGLLLGPFVGAVLGELSVRRGFNQASRAGVGATLGMLIGAAFKLALGVAMVGLFLIARFWSDAGQAPGG